MIFRKAACEAAAGAIAFIVVTSAPAVLSGSTANFSTLVADHPGCAVDAGIAQWKIEQSLGYGNVHRDAFDPCLERQLVRQHKIEVLDNCVAARSG